jgi:hypothetical protein
MRVENSFPTQVESRGERPQKAGKVAPASLTQTDHFTSSTADLVSLALGSRSLQPAASLPVGRDELIGRLKSAYDSGVIRPDADRIAAALLRFGTSPSGESV